MSMQTCRKYIESEISKGKSKSDIEKYLKKNYREGLWNKQLLQYPEKKDFEKNKLLNYIFMGYSVLILLLSLRFWYLYIKFNPDKWWTLLLIYRSIPLIFPILLFFEAKKGKAGGYIMGMLFPFLLGFLTESLLDTLITLPLAIIGYILKVKMHPNWGFIFPPKPQKDKK